MRPISKLCCEKGRDKELSSYEKMPKRLVVYKKMYIKPARKIRSRNVFRSFDKHTPLKRKTKGLTNAGYSTIQVKTPQKHNRNSLISMKGGKICR